MAVRISPEAVYTLAEVLEILKVSDATVRRWIKEGRLKAQRRPLISLFDRRCLRGYVPFRSGL